MVKGVPSLMSLLFCLVIIAGCSDSTKSNDKVSMTTGGMNTSLPVATTPPGGGRSMATQGIIEGQRSHSNQPHSGDTTPPLGGTPIPSDMMGGIEGIDVPTLPPGDTDLEAALVDAFDFVHRIGGFYIAGYNQAPRDPNAMGATGRDAFEQAIRLFSSYLDRDENGQVDHIPLLTSLGKNFVFAIGYDPQLRPQEEAIDRRFGRYVMSMKTDIWPYRPNYNGEGSAPTSLSSSTWRPEIYNALWEETFHTITEAYNRMDPNWGFETESPLGRAMQSDIDAGTYDTEEQNREEMGQYDFITAVNEYVHQIWMIQLFGGSDILTTPQRTVLDTMKATPGFPMRVNKEYQPILGISVRGID